GSLHWSPDSTKLIYTSMRTGVSKIFEYDFKTDKETQLTHGTGMDRDPRWDPNGKAIAFIRGKHEVHLLTLKSGKDVVLAHDNMWFPELKFSPAGDWLAYTYYGVDGFINIKVVPATGGEARPVSFLANGETAQQIAWSPDGKYMLFATAQRSENSEMARVDLVLRTPVYAENEFYNLFKPPAHPKPKTSSESASKGQKTASAASGGAGESGSGVVQAKPVKILCERDAAGDQSGRQDAGICRARGGRGEPVQLVAQAEPQSSAGREATDGDGWGQVRRAVHARLEVDCVPAGRSCDDAFAGWG
ncbi:MAG: hypothetical protein M1568_00070, partial [Acidobacteria bacterium]|nr:hypothetical protein [Acidobacteriota bacterium]